MQLYATFVKNKCNFFVQQKLALVPMSAAARANEIEGAPAEYEGL